MNDKLRQVVSRSLRLMRGALIRPVTALSDRCPVIPANARQSTAVKKAGRSAQQAVPSMIEMLERINCRLDAIEEKSTFCSCLWRRSSTESGLPVNGRTCACSIIKRKHRLNVPAASLRSMALGLGWKVPDPTGSSRPGSFRESKYPSSLGPSLSFCNIRWRLEESC
jgi:hypothetical protein